MQTSSKKSKLSADKKPSAPSDLRTTILNMPKLHKLIFDMSSERYHSIKGTWSSSQFKDLLEDEEIFIKKYIHKVIEKEDNEAFGTGNFFHTGVLEPHKLKKDCIVYPGKVRHGGHWETFKKKHANKTIVTERMMETAQRIIDVVHESPVAMGYIQRGKPEVSLFVELNVLDGVIYAPRYEKYLTRTGWVDMDSRTNLKKAVKFIVKVRADSKGDTFVLDLKSTTGNARNEFAMREKIKYYNYDLSASMYLDIFSLEEPDIKDFLWTFASKDCFNSKTYRATRENILVGRAKFMRTVLSLAVCMANDWAIYDSLGELGPHPTDMWLIEERDEDLL